MHAGKRLGLVIPWPVSCPAFVSGGGNRSAGAVSCEECHADDLSWVREGRGSRIILAEEIVWCGGLSRLGVRVVGMGGCFGGWLVRRVVI